VTAATGLLLLAVGAVNGLIVGLIWGYLTSDRDAHAEVRALRARAAKADACLAEIQAALETGDGLAEADDWAQWSRELREAQ
jgi:hypothetical protein